MAEMSTGGGTMLPSFQSMLQEALKAEGLIPMTTGITKPTVPATSYSVALQDAGFAVDQAAVQFGSRASDRYSTGVGSSYRDQRFAMIASLENVQTTAYNDSGNMAVGLGFNMDKPGARTVWKDAFGTTDNFDAVRAGTQSITPAQAKQLFDHDILYFERLVDTVAGERPLTQNQRLALVSVAYTTPARVSKWGPVVQSGDDSALMDLILTNSFRADHPQADGLKSRRYIEAAVFAGTAEAGDLMPTFNDYMQAVQVNPATGQATVNGNPVVDGQPALVAIDQTVGGAVRQGVAIPLAEFGYGYSSSTKRDLPVREELVHNIQQSVTAVYGADYRATVISGAQGEGSNGQTGSRRHNTGVAADVYVYSPTGQRLTPDELVPLAQHWVASSTGSVGFPANGQSLHLDLIGGNGPGAVPLQAGEGRVWYYGSPTSAQRSALNAGLAGTAPKYTLSPEIVAKGLVPPESLPTVATQLDVASPPVPATPSRALRVERALNQPSNGAPVPATQSADLRISRNPEVSAEAKAAQVNRLPNTSITAPVPQTMSENVRMARVSVAQRRTAPTPLQRPASIQTAARQIGNNNPGVVLSGVGTMGVSGATARRVTPTTVVRAVTGVSSAQAYSNLTAASRGAPTLEDRVSGRASNSDNVAQSLSS